MPDEPKKLGPVSPEVMAELWQAVDYTYVSYTQFVSSSNDVRILFGDRLPPDGRPRPLLGIVLSHAHAKSVLEAFANQMAQLDAALKAAKAEEPEKVEPEG